MSSARVDEPQLVQVLDIRLAATICAMLDTEPAEFTYTGEGNGYRITFWFRDSHALQEVMSRWRSKESFDGFNLAAYEQWKSRLLSHRPQRG